MKEPQAPKERPILTAHEPHPSPGEARRGEGPRYVVSVRYYRRMKVKKVYPMVVNVRPLADHLRGVKSHTPTLEIRPVVPGAQVTPSHYELDTTGSTPAFYVTPVARGRLADASLEVYSHGRLVQEIPVPMQGTRQLSTWILLLLTILVPFGIYYFTRHVNLSSGGASIPYTPAVSKSQAEPEEEEAPELPNKKMTEQERKSMMAMIKTKGPPPSPIGDRLPGVKKEADKAEAPGDDPKPVLAPPPKLKGPVEKATMNLLPDFSFGSQWVASHLNPPKATQYVYDWAENLGPDYLSFYVGLGLLALTALSWVLHAARRSSRRGQPIALGA